MRRDPNLLDLVGAKGAAIRFGGQWTTIGRTPPEEELNFLVQWLNKNVDDDIYVTNALPLEYSEAQRFKDVASGLIAIPISRHSYVLWFRPEVLQTVNWGGNPNQAYSLVGDGDNQWLCPRQSFELWKETVSLQSLPWQGVEVKAALELRKAIVNIVLRQAEELALLAHDLERSNAELKKFAYVASHDLQEPLNQVANFVQLLEMRYDTQLDTDGKEFIGFAVEGVSLMQTLIDDVLTYSKVDLKGIEWELTNVQDALDQALGNLRGRIGETGAVVTADDLPTIVADGTQLMQLFQNLLGNAIKFRKQDVTPQIHIGVERQEDNWLFSVTDNGIGLESAVLPSASSSSSSGCTPGMSTQARAWGWPFVRKSSSVIGGRIWVESTPNAGATFYFTIPVEGREIATMATAERPKIIFLVEDNRGRHSAHSGGPQKHCRPLRSSHRQGRHGGHDLPQRVGGWS